jgi:ribosomal protein L16 Arg81 hydroxylase
MGRFNVSKDDIIKSIKVDINRYEELLNDLEKEFVLEPGDVIFVPAGLMHEIVPLMPRAALSFAVKFIN